MLKINQLSTFWEEKEYAYNFRIKKGDFVGIIGPSGGGKSTLLNLIAGLLPIYGGKIEFGSRDITQVSAHKRPVSLLFQAHNLFEHLSIWKNMAMGLKPNLRLSDKECEQVQLLAEELEIADFLKRKPGELSGGQQQRVAIGRILLRRQPILLLDEPFSALDGKLRDELLKLIYKVHQQNNMTTLMVSHHPDELQDIVDDFIVVEPPE